MAQGSSPINISQSRHASNSPRQASNLTSALQSGNGGAAAPTAPMNIGGQQPLPPGARSESIGMSGLTPQYSKPVPIAGSGKSQPRRESMAGSMMNGMSWGGVSMNSWIRDDIMMQGSSPFAGGIQSPSYHSSSYLPKLEANFMKDFTCCNQILPSLHDLLQHYEEQHAQQQPVAGGAKPLGPFAPQPQAQSSRAAPQQPKQPTATVAVPADEPSVDPTATTVQPTPKPPQPSAKTAKQHVETSQEMEAAQDMEMDDIDAEGDDDPSIPAGYAMPQSDDFTKSAGPSSRLPPLDLDAAKMANMRQSFQGMRQSQPSTPLSGRLFNNPTVSSVNTPTISTNPRQRLVPRTPDTSIPGTPAELDPDFLSDVGNMSMDNPTFMPNQSTDFSNFAFNGGRDLGELCIDDPGKSLSKPTVASQQATIQSKLGDAQYGPDSDVARNIRDRQVKAGLADTVSGIPNGEEPKPFRCPVIGCEKAYKNQNGLKYHKLHGHNNQRLQNNNDGTYSIIDPDTNAVFPGTMGMEKEKPYKCDVCAKRYKNLNGLKYHKTHSPPCNPDNKINPGMPINTNSHSANVAGAGYD